MELSASDATALGIAEGDLVRVASRRGAIEARARISGPEPAYAAASHSPGAARSDRPGQPRRPVASRHTPGSSSPSPLR